MGGQISVNIDGSGSGYGTFTNEELNQLFEQLYQNQFEGNGFYAVPYSKRKITTSHQQTISQPSPSPSPSQAQSSRSFALLQVSDQMMTSLITKFNGGILFLNQLEKDLQKIQEISQMELSIESDSASVPREPSQTEKLSLSLKKFGQSEIEFLTKEIFYLLDLLKGRNINDQTPYYHPQLGKIIYPEIYCKKDVMKYIINEKNEAIRKKLINEYYNKLSKKCGELSDKYDDENSDFCKDYSRIKIEYQKYNLYIVNRGMLNLIDLVSFYYNDDQIVYNIMSIYHAKTIVSAYKLIMSIYRPTPELLSDNGLELNSSSSSSELDAAQIKCTFNVLYKKITSEHVPTKDKKYIEFLDSMFNLINEK
jgi:hypothetical protein